MSTNVPIYGRQERCFKDREERRDASRNRVEKRDVSGTMYSEEGRQLKDREGRRDISGNRVVKGDVSRNQR
jgi:hypothetical protein